MEEVLSLHYNKGLWDCFRCSGASFLDADTVYFQGELYPCGERSLDLLRPPRLQGPAVHPGARRVPRVPEVELPQRPHGILQAHPHGKHLWGAFILSHWTSRSHISLWATFRFMTSLFFICKKFTADIMASPLSSSTTPVHNKVSAELQQ